MKITLIQMLAALSLAASAPLAIALTTAFNYQGRLDSGGVPVNGSSDLTFTLYNAASGGSTVGTSNVVNDLLTSDGLFTVTLDFGAGAFDGSPRWLEIAARPGASTGAYTNLAPRTPITSTPYAMFANTASNLSGALPGVALSGTYGSAVNLNNAANRFSGSGANLTALNASQLTTGTVSDARLSANVALRAGGNAFSGDQIITGGKLGLGTATPGNLLDVAAGGVIGNSTVLGANVHDVLNQGPKVSFGYNISGTEFLGMSAVVNPGTARCGNSGDLLFYAWECNTALSREVVRINGSGNVGLGTTNPATKLTVFESTYGIEHTDGTRRLATYIDATGCYLGSRSADPLLFYVNDSASSMMIATNGFVGIGTSTPGTTLTVAGLGYGIEHTDGTRRLATYLDASGCFLGSRSADPLLFYVNDGAASLMIATNGNVGIGVDPTTRLDVGGTVKALNFIGDGSGLTALDANGMMSGTLPNERLSTDVARRNGGNLFFGQQNISGNLDVDGTVTANSLIGDGSGLTGVALRAGGNTFTGDQIVTGGSVGIGATSPLDMGGASYPGSWDGLHTRSLTGNGLNIIQGAASARLHLRADNNLADGSQDFIINNGANRIDFSWLTPGLGNRLNAMTIATNGNVGIGNNNPTAKLLVNGDTRVNGRLTINGAAGDYASVALIAKQLANTSVVASFLDSLDHELVTITDPVASGLPTLYVSMGDAAKPGGGSWASLSDARAKKNIRDLEGALPRLLALHSVSFEYKDPKALGARPGTQIGFVAQEVEPIFPDWVSTDAKGTKMLSIRGFESLTVAALREMQAEKDVQFKKLEAQNAELKQMNTALETRLAALEKLMSNLTVAQGGPR